MRVITRAPTWLSTDLYTVYSHEQLLESILLRSFQAPSAPYILAPSSCTSIIDCRTPISLATKWSVSLLGPARSLLGPAHSNKGTLGALDSGKHSRIAFRQLQQATTPLRDGCSAINDAGTTRRCEYIRRRWCLKGSQQYRLQ